MVLNETVITQKLLFILSCCLCFAVIFILRDLYRKRHIFKFAGNFKGYRFYPVIGNAYYTFGKDVFTVIKNVKEKHGLPCNLWIGHDYRYITANASEIKVILNHRNTFNKGSIYDLVRIALENTLIMASFDDWKRNRKIYSRSFSQPMLNSFVDTFYGKACTLVEILKKGHLSNVYDVFDRLSLENFCANILSMDLVIQRDMNNKLIHLFDRLQSLASKQAFNGYFLPEYIFFHWLAFRFVLKDYFEIKSIVSKMVQQRKEIIKKEKETSDFREDSSKLRLMNIMLEEEGKTFTDEEICREIILFLIAATDTSGITLSFTFTLLGMDPEVQEKLYQEVKQTVGLEGPICHSDLPNLKYTERVLFETLRLFPTISMMERHVDADVNIGDKVVPAGANVMISVFNLHRSEAYWKNPLEFDPDRFLPEEVEKRHPYAFIPFSSGPRNCIGLKYALMMMKTTVAHVIRNYEVKSKYKSVAEMKLTSFVTLKTVHKLDCSFIPRAGKII